MPRARRVSAGRRRTPPKPLSPVAEWVVVLVEDNTTTFIQQLGDTAFGLAARWSCVASLATERLDGKRVDTLTVSCTKRGVEVRARAQHVEGAAPVALTQLQISTGLKKKPIVTIAFRSRARKR